MNTLPPLLLLAGGDNSRFFPLNTNTHKGCRLVAGKPLLVRALENAVEYGFTQIVIVVSQKDFDNQGISKQLKDYALPASIECVLQPQAVGQADAILRGLEKISTAESCIVASPYYLDLGELSAQLTDASQKTTAACIFLGSETDQPEQYGILSIKGNQVTGVTEKPEVPQSNKKINSVYFLRQSFLKYLKTTPVSEYSLETAFDSFCKNHPVEWIETEEHPSLKFAWQLLEFMDQVLKQQVGFISPLAHVAKTAILDDSDGPIVVEEGAVIKDFVKISGPAYIGANTLVGEFSFIRRSSIEKNVIVGARTEVVRSLLETACSIHSSYCADSIIGSRTSVSAGLITANKRLDRTEIFSTVKEKKVSTKRRALGVIIGEDVNLGIAVHTMPGVLIGERSTIYPGQTVFKTVPAHSTVKNSSTGTT